APIAKAVEVKPEAAKPTSQNNDFLSAMQSLTRAGASNEHKNLGRNDPCWCGKKKADGTPVKYKNCHYPN
ncbi:MAG: hypothetical protein UU16_C0053G0001, partial [Candidatus Woesebacteria bacterium GW2011_GWA2_40_7]